MQKSSFFNAIISTDGVPDRAYLAEDFARYFNSFIGNGVFPTPVSGLQVVAVDSNMDIRIRAGKGWINGYFYENTDDYALKIDVADGLLNRIDRVVLRLDFISREIKAYVKKGERDGVNAKPPTLIRDTDMYELGIADIAVNKGIIKLTQADITDLRFSNAYCGIVKGVVDQIDTTNLFAQYQSEFDIWFKNVKDQLGESVAGNLQNQITQNKIDINKKVDDFIATKGNPNGIASLGVDGKLPKEQFPQFSGKAIFKEPGTFTWQVPSTVEFVWITASAAGGGGSAQYSASSYGGKAGGITSFGTFMSLEGGSGGRVPDGYLDSTGKGGSGKNCGISGNDGKISENGAVGIGGTGQIDQLGGATFISGKNSNAILVGGGGDVKGTTSLNYSGGGGGACTYKYPIKIPNATASVQITVGAGGTSQFGNKGQDGILIIEW